MRVFVSLILLMVFVSAFSQSKKDLEAQVKKLQTEIEQLKKSKEVLLNTQNQKAGYAMGVLFANNIKSQGGDSLDVETLTAAVKDVFTNKALKMEQQQCMPVVQQYMQVAIEKKTTAAKEQGKAFLEANKTKEGVQATASGLQYKVLTSGTGKTPTISDVVTVHYTGRLIDGTVFDSSVNRGQPYNTKLTDVIRGWTEALQLMKEGDKWMVFIPSELGYGERGSGPQIRPYSTLIFEMELIKVN